MTMPIWQRLKRDRQENGNIDPGLTLFGLRHTVAVVLRELGQDERTIVDVLGQKTSRWLKSTPRAQIWA